GDKTGESLLKGQRIAAAAELLNKGLFCLQQGDFPVLQRFQNGSGLQAICKRFKYGRGSGGAQDGAQRQVAHKVKPMKIPAGSHDEFLLFFVKETSLPRIGGTGKPL